MIKHKEEKCPHLDCLVYHPNGVCHCDMGKYCEECKKFYPAECKPNPAPDKRKKEKIEKVRCLNGKNCSCYKPLHQVKDSWEKELYKLYTKDTNVFIIWLIFKLYKYKLIRTVVNIFIFLNILVVLLNVTLILLVILNV